MPIWADGDFLTPNNLNNQTVTALTSASLLASANDSGAIGASGTAFSDLFLASGAVINFNAGDITLTHSSNVLALAGGDFSLDGDLDFVGPQAITTTTGDLTLNPAGDVVISDNLTVSGTGPHAFGTSALNFIQFHFAGSFTSGGASNQAYAFDVDTALTGVAGDTTFLTIGLFSGNVNTQASETVTTVSQLRVTEPAIVVGGGGTVTNSASLYITGAADEATNNYALWVDAGDVRLDGKLRMTEVNSQIIPGTTSFGILNAAATVNNFHLLDAGGMFLGDTSNANMTVGLTINQGAADNQILALKSSDVAHALLSGHNAQSNDIDIETDDFFTITKMRAGSAGGGVVLRAIAEDAAVDISNFEIQAYGFRTGTTDDTNDVGLMNIFAAEHDGANALRDAATNDNLFTIQSWSGSARVTRLLLKGDDGELHLGNTTLVALDEEDDISLIRAMQWETSKGAGMKPKPWTTEDYGVPVFSHEKLMAIGVLGEKDDEGNCLMRVQPRFAMNEGAIWQLYVGQEEMKEVWAKERKELQDAIKRLKRLLPAA